MERALFIGEEFFKNVFEDTIIRINHIGSTSVEGLLAKPIIDILLKISEGIDLTDITEKMKDYGYTILPIDFNPPEFDKVIY